MHVKINPTGVSKYLNGANFAKSDLDITFLDFPKAMNGEFRYIASLVTISGDMRNISDVTVKSDDPHILIPSEHLDAGVFKSRISYILNGREIRRFRIEDLVITQVNDEFERTPRLDNIEKSITELSEKLDKSVLRIEGRNKELAALIEDSAKTISLLKSNMLALIRFAFKDYSSNIYLDGSNELDKFIAEFNFTLEPDDLK